MAKQIAPKTMINSTYEIKFFIGGDDVCSRYRAKGTDGKNYLLKFYDQAQLSENDLFSDKLYEVEILATHQIDGIEQYISDGKIMLNGVTYYYVVYSFTSGETLQEKIQREGALSEFAASSITARLLEILKEMHEKHIPLIHNNINPQTVFFDYKSRTNEPLLTNLFFARYDAQSKKGQTLVRSHVAPIYLAPELFSGKWTTQSDIYSVGAVLYFMITGRAPWNSQSLEKRKKISFVQQGEDAISPSMQALIIKALGFNVEDRFSTIDEFIDALNGESQEVTNVQKDKKGVSQYQPSIKTGNGFADIAGMEAFKELLYNDVIRALKEKELYSTYGLTIPNGMLLYGPPGCGKTYISQRFAEEIGYGFLELKPSDIASRYINATSENIGEIFKVAEENAPTIIFIDEIDAVVPKRDNGLHQMHASAVNEFLAQMSNCAERGIFVIAASNRPDKIDNAFLRTGRIDRLVYLSPPDLSSRIAMFKLYLNNRPVDLLLDYEELGKKTENYVSSDIKFLVDEASRLALNTRSRINQETFDTVLASTRPSVSFELVSKYEKLRETFEGTSKDKSTEKPKRIGFS